MGRGTEPGVEVGPLVDEAGRRKVTELVEDAVAQGARVATGGGPLGGPGYFFAPTVLDEVPATARTLREEISARSRRSRGSAPRREEYLETQYGGIGP